MASSTIGASDEVLPMSEATSAPVAYKNPFLWVPTSYFAMGLVYVTVGSVANIMFKNMGMPNDQAAFWSSILGFPYTFKFLWAPALELYKTKKFFVVLMQFSIAMRKKEVGIRMAVGARPADIFGMIIREGLTLSLKGLMIGLVGALGLGQAASSLLFGVTATDPLTFVTVSLLLTVVAAGACFFPARRAMTVEPTTALRQD